MQKVILLTGSTDGIGLEVAKRLVDEGHHVLLHGRNPQKLEVVKRELSGRGRVEAFVADLSSLADVEALAEAVKAATPHLDVLINNAGVYKVPNPTTEQGLDLRFVVNAFAPYYLTRLLLDRMTVASRVVNVSSAAQAPVDLAALRGRAALSDHAAYAQSKLALTMWSRTMGQQPKGGAPSIVAVNPGSMLASKMVKQAFGVSGASLEIGADILTRAALEPGFMESSGLYFDNDAGRFAQPHPDALDAELCAQVLEAIETIVKDDADRRRS